jgi:hypothetical protein
MTVRDVLQQLGALGRVENPYGESLLNQPVKTHGFCTASGPDDKPGRVFVSCGGDAFYALRNDFHTFYLAYDDAEGKRWDREAAVLSTTGDYNPAGTLGMRPFARIALRWSA